MLAGLCAVLPGSAPAQAHAYLATSNPADGAVLDRAPSGLTLSFTESVERAATRVEIVDGDGRHWAPTSIALRQAGAPEAAGSPAGEADTESPVDLVVGLPVLPANTYRVTWHTLSSDDLHVTRGDLVFGVQRQVHASVAPVPAGPGPLESAPRALGLLGTAVLVGGAALALLLGAAGRAGAPGLAQRLLGDAAAGGMLALVAVPALLLVQVSRAGGGTGGLLVGELLDGRWLVREASLAALVGIVWWTRGPATGGVASEGRRDAAAADGGVASEGRGDAADGATGDAVGPPGGAEGAMRRLPVPWLALAGVSALTLAGSTALLGHPSGGGPATTLIGGAHVLAAAGWAGAVIAAGLALVPRGREVAGWAVRGRVLLRAFAPLAVASLGTLTVTGLLMTGTQVSTVDALLTTPYGLLLVAKVLAVAVAGLLGLRTARRLRAPGDRAVRRGLAAEAVLLGVVLVLAGTLAAAAPARGARFDAATGAPPEAESTGQVADLVDTVAVRPNRPGPNVVTVTVSQTRRPVPGPVSGVALELRGPDGTSRVYPMARGADGTFSAPVADIRAPGRWRLVVTVQRTGMPPVSDPHRWVVAGAAPSAAPVVVSSARLRPWTGLLAWLAVLAVALVAAVAGYRRRAALRAWTARLGPPARSGPLGRPDGAADPDLVASDAVASDAAPSETHPVAALAPADSR